MWNLVVVRGKCKPSNLPLQTHHKRHARIERYHLDVDSLSEDDPSTSGEEFEESKKEDGWRMGRWRQLPPQ
jgi:hypothetical protein